MWRALLVLLMVLFVTARPAAADDWDDCRSASSNRRIAACTNIIDNPSETRERRAEAYNTRGANEYWLLNFLDWSLNDFNEAIRLNPEYAEAYYNRGVAQLSIASPKSARLLSAIADLTQAIKFKPGYTEAYSKRADAYAKNGDLALAAADHVKAGEPRTDDAEAYYRRGLALYQGAKKDLAIADLAKALRLKPHLVFDLHNWSCCSAGKSIYDHSNVIAVFDGILQHNSKLSDAYYYRGKAHHAKEDREKAIADFGAALAAGSDRTYYNPDSIPDLDKIIELYPSASALAYFHRGRAHHAKGDRAKAIPDFRKAVELNPLQLGHSYYQPSTIADLDELIGLTGLPEAYFLRGEAYAKLGHWQKAIADLNIAALRKRHLTLRYYNLLFDLRPKRDFDDLLAAFDGIIAADRDHAPAYFERGLVYLRMQRYVLAVEDFKRALHLKLDRPDAQHGLTIALESETLRVGPPLAEAHYRRGEAYASGSIAFDKHASNIDLAIRDYSEAIRLNDKWVAPHKARGHVYDRTKQYVQALADFSAAIDRDPKSAGAYMARGDMQSIAEQYDLAINDYTKVIDLAPDWVERAYMARGILHYLAGRHDQAVADYSEAKRRNSDWFASNYSRIVSTTKLPYGPGFSEKDIAYSTEVIRLKPDDAGAIFKRGSVYHATGAHDQAIKDWRKAVALEPAHWFKFLASARDYDKQGKHDLALAEYAKSIAVKPDLAHGYAERAALHRRTGKNDQAIADYNEAIRLDPVHGNRYYGRATAHYAKGDHQLALADYDAFLRLKSTRDGTRALHLNDEYPTSASFYFSRARAYFGNGQYMLAALDTTNSVYHVALYELSARKIGDYTFKTPAAIDDVLPYPAQLFIIAVVVAVCAFFLWSLRDMILVPFSLLYALFAWVLGAIGSIRAVTASSKTNPDNP